MRDYRLTGAGRAKRVPFVVRRRPLHGGGGILVLPAKASVIVAYAHPFTRARPLDVDTGSCRDRLETLRPEEGVYYGKKVQIFEVRQDEAGVTSAWSDLYGLLRDGPGPEYTAVHEIVGLALRVQITGIEVVDLNLSWIKWPQTGVLHDVKSEEAKGAGLAAPLPITEHPMHEAHIAGPPSVHTFRIVIAHPVSFYHSYKAVEISDS